MKLKKWVTKLLVVLCGVDIMLACVIEEPIFVLFILALLLGIKTYILKKYSNVFEEV